jgi:hypothetical protein
MACGGPDAVMRPARRTKMRSQCRIVLNRFSVSPSRSDVASSYKYVSIYKARREWRTPSMAYTQVASSVFRWGYENRP